MNTHPEQWVAMLQRPGSSWGFGALLKDTSVVVLEEDTPPTNNPCRTWDSNPQPSIYKSDSLSIRPRLPDLFQKHAVFFCFFSSSAAPVPIHFHCMTQSIISFRLNISYLVEKMSNGFGISWGWGNDSSFLSEPFLSLVWGRGNSVISKTAHWTHN